MQAKKLGIKIVETAAHKPTDQDFTASLTKLKAAGCDLVAMGTIVRDSIVPYAAARKMGWTDVDFLGSAAVYDLRRGRRAQGMEGFYAMGLTEMPYGDSRVAVGQSASSRTTRTSTTSIRTSARSTATSPPTSRPPGLKNAGKDLTLDSFMKGLESIKNYQDIFNGPRSVSARTSGRARTPRSSPWSRTAAGTASRSRSASSRRCQKSRSPGG